ncbi:hypothetical protein BDY21DRAFT_136295 [Lineolata rhizophorae]|uniref:REM-1 domain-containing protein n=1 Tax=Lineolata rhizophorae TaxID=578093 RepID=A0A6A6PAM3_9PEZI|nr:hypothetical protein BDY21DRAFT_136295 [Lineolata rhizophorae]
MNNEEEVIRDVNRKIEREKALITAANAMRQSTGNQAVLSRLGTQIRDGQRNIEYLEGRLREIQMRRMGSGMEGMSLGPGGGRGSGGSVGGGGGGSSSAAGGGPAPPSHDNRGDSYMDAGSYGSPGPGGYSQLSGGRGLMPPRAPYAPPAPASNLPSKPRSNYTKLGGSWPVAPETGRFA